MPLEKRAWDVMDTNFETVTPETPLKEACLILSGKSREKKGILGLVVMRASGEYLGLLTIKEILKYLDFLANKLKREGKAEDWETYLSGPDKDGSWVTVNDIMISYDVFARPNQGLFELIRIMEENDLEVIPVADGGKIIGVIQPLGLLRGLIA
ncbi:MAG: CBS domain-containing protein [Deltaproteobacteria bacterium]|nr:CBS domain-containing protein [Deltaproteobacteria bacterium]